MHRIGLRLFRAAAFAGAAFLWICALCAQADQLTVSVNIPPHAYLVDRIGEAHVSVHVLVEPGQSPHTFEPTPRQILELSRADLYLRGGMPFERQLVDKIQGSGIGLRVMDISQGIEEEAGHTHPRGEAHPEAEAHRGQADPHVWLAPPFIEVLATNVAAALQKEDPAHAEEYQRNLDVFLNQLGAVHQRILEKLAPYRGRPFFVFHPAFEHFADAYGLRQVAVEAEGKAPTPRRLAAIIQEARAEGVRVIFAQPQFDQQSAQAVAAAIGGSVVPMDPLARDVLANIEDMAEKILRALGPGTFEE